MTDPALWIALRDVPGLDRAAARRLIEAFGTPEEIFGRSPGDFEGLCPEGVAGRLSRDPPVAAARAELERTCRCGFGLLLQGKAGFPPRLLEISDPPLVLYVNPGLADPAGVGPFEESSISIVGSRRATARGRETARSFAAELAGAGLTIVSGLAYGIDAAAHLGALEGGGRTIAILAGGLDRPGPAGNVPMARRMLREGGLWLSEHGPGTEARAWHFPDRNRLISGLSRATLVIEAREGSGSLWTARHAADQSRQVLVVPGPIDTDACRGSNRLLFEGAAPVLQPEDVFQHAFGRLDPPVRPRASAPPGPGGDAGRILDRVGGGPCGPDDLVRELGLPAPRVASLLVELEIEGWIARDGRRVSRGPRATRGSGG
jgi:DNA processing protein